MKDISFSAKIIAVAVALLMPSQASATAMCTAANDEGGTCSIECPIGLAAQCTNTTASNPPICQCINATAQGNDLSNLQLLMTGDFISYMQQEGSEPDGIESVLSSSRRCASWRNSGHSGTIILQDNCSPGRRLFRGEWVTANHERIPAVYRIGSGAEREVQFRGIIGDIIEEVELDCFIQVQPECLSGEDHSSWIRSTRETMQIPSGELYLFGIRNSHTRYYAFVVIEWFNASGKRVFGFSTTLRPGGGGALHATQDPNEFMRVTIARRDSL